MAKISAPDLNQHSPRSPRVRLGGYVHLPRLLDKARAFAARQHGEYNYNCPLDRMFFEFTGIGHKAFLAAVKTGKSDTEMLAWVNGHSKRLPPEIVQWSTWMERTTTVTFRDDDNYPSCATRALSCSTNPQHTAVIGFVEQLRALIN